MFYPTFRLKGGGKDWKLGEQKLHTVYGRVNHVGMRISKDPQIDDRENKSNEFLFLSTQRVSIIQVDRYQTEAKLRSNLPPPSLGTSSIK